MIRGSLTLWLCIAFTGAAQQADTPGPTGKAAITAAHTIFLTEINTAQGHEDTSGQMLRATLESTKRFTVLPGTRGADLLLIYDSVYAAIGPPEQAPLLELTLRDGKTFANLGTLQAPWATFPTVAKDEQAVTQLLNALFALDTSRPVPAFTVAPVPVNGVTEALGAEVSPLKALFTLPHINPDMERELSPGHSVLLVGDVLPGDFPAGYGTLAQTFVADLGTSTGLHFVDSLADADIVLLVQGTEGMYNGYWKQWIAAGGYDAKTLMPITGVQVVAKSGKTKKGKPSPAEGSMGQLADKFRGRLAKRAKDAAKK